MKLTMNDIILYLIFSLAFIFIITLSYVIYRNRKNARLWYGLGNSKYISINSNQLFLRIYNYLNNFPLTNNYIKKISYRYRLICPCDTRTIARKTIGSCFISWIISLSTFIFVFMSNPRLITLITVGFAIYIINTEVASRLAKRHEINTLYEMQKMLADVVHYFYVEYRIDDAIYRAREHVSQDMKAVLDQIYQLLLSRDREESVREYYYNIPNKYLRAFVSQCIGVMERGDQVVDGKLLFVRNLENLQREIDIEIDKLQRLNMEFMGVIICVVSPIFCIDLVKQFAISLKENMVDFYYGRQGFLLDIGLLLIILVIYVIMRKSAEYISFHQSSHKWLFRIDRIRIVKRSMDNYCEKNASKQARLQRELRNNGNNIRARHFVLRSFLIAILVFFLSIGVTIYLYKMTKEQLLIVKPNEIESLIPSARDIEYETMANIIEGYTKKYIDSPSLKPEKSDDLVEVFKADGIIYNFRIAKTLAEEVLLRVNKYQNEYISFFDFALCILISIIAYYIPRILLKYSSSVSRDAMEDEVNQFLALIGMLMYDRTMTVKIILMEMESFAIVFKQSIRMCIDDYGSGDLDALNKLKEREPYEPFRRIVDNLLRCDEMPISQAFSEIQVDKDGYIAKRKLANEKSIRKRVFRAYVLAALPFIMLFAYGLMPALISSMNELNQIIEELENIAW